MSIQSVFLSAYCFFSFELHAASVRASHYVESSSILPAYWYFLLNCKYLHVMHVISFLNLSIDCSFLLRINMGCDILHVTSSEWGVDLKFSIGFAQIFE